MGGRVLRRLGRGALRAMAADPSEWVPTLAAVLLIAGLALRLHGYTSYPRFGANEDEIGWAWLGQSLWLYHWPASWSYLPEHLPVTAVATSRGVFLPWICLLYTSLLRVRQDCDTIVRNASHPHLRSDISDALLEEGGRAPFAC